MGGNQTVTGSATFNGPLTVSNGVGLGGSSEGGEINLAYAQSTTLTGSNVVFDVYSDKVRIFENGGNNRGVSIDLSKASAGVGSELMWKASGIVNAGTFVQLDNIKATVTTGGQRGLSLATVSGNIAINMAGNFAGSGVGTGGSSGTATITTSASTSLFGWGFTATGDMANYIITDTTNSRAYRIIIQIGLSFNNNLVSIERLH